MDDIFRVGFAIDTVALAAGQNAVVMFTDKLGGLAKAQADQEAAAKRTTEAQKTAATGLRDQQGAVTGLAGAWDRMFQATAGMGARMRTEVAGGLQGAGAAATGAAAGITSLTGALAQARGAMMGGPGSLASGVGAVTTGLQGLLPVMGSMGALLGPLALGLTALAGAYVGVAAAVVNEQEAFLMYEARLKGIYKTAGEAGAVLSQISKLAQENGVAMNTAADSFLRLARNNSAIGLTKDELIGLTDAVQKLGRISGASQGEIGSGLMQFSQALAAGRLNGDELRSIMENFPALTERIAKGLGVSVGQLRAMGAEGQLTSDKIVGSLMGQIGDIQKEFEDLPQTTDMSFTRIGNAWDRLMAGMGERLQASQLLAGIGNLTAAAIDGAADMVAPKTAVEIRRDTLDRMVLARDAPRVEDQSFMQNLRDSMFASPATSLTEGNVVATDLPRPEPGAIRELQMQVFRDAEYESRRNVVVKETAEFERSKSVAAEVDDMATKTKRLQEQINALQPVWDRFRKSPELFDKAQAESVSKYGALLAALRNQLVSLASPLETYERTTLRMRQNVDVFGAGGAASLAEEAQKLVDQSAGKGVEIPWRLARDAVQERRVLDVETRTQALDLEIASQQRLTDVLGQGTEAQMAAEAAITATNLQMQLFGDVTTPAAKDAIGAYADKLLELAEAKRDLADATKLQNDQEEIAIERALLASERMGANAGQLRELERYLRLQQDLGDLGVMGGSDVPVDGALNPGQVAGHVQTDGLTGSIQAVADAILTAFPGAVMSSGVRHGDGSSQHDHGKAADFDFSALSPDDRKRAVAMLTSGQGAFANVGGIGTYDGTGALVHADVREGANMAWGPNRSRTSLPETPDWFQSMVANWSSGSGQTRQPVWGVPAAGSNPGVDLALAGAELDTLRATREEEAKLRELERKRADLAAQADAPSVSDERRMQREAEARDYAAGFDPARQDAAYAEKMATFEEQDRGAVNDQMRAVERETELAEERLRISRLGGRERKIELAVLEEINKAQQAGLELTQAQVEAIRASAAERIAAEEATPRQEEAADRYKGVWKDAAGEIGSSLEDAIMEATKKGTVDAEALLDGLVSDIIQSIMKAYITQPLVTGLSDMINGWGGGAAPTANAFGGVIGATAYAAGGVVDRPIAFRAAAGVGLMGEAGPEAILPLKRGADGRLGVGGGGGGMGKSSITIFDQRSAAGASPVEVEENTGPDGERMVQVMIRDEVRRAVRGGDLDKEMGAAYGIRRSLTQR